MGELVWQAVAGILTLAIVYLLVRPNSPASEAVRDVGIGLRDLVRAAVG